MRRLWVLLLCGTLSLSLFGCGASKADEEMGITEMESGASKADKEMASDASKADKEMAFSSFGSAEREDVEVYRLGDTIETDIFRFTLNRAQLTIKMNSTGYYHYDNKSKMLILDELSPDYFLADEYDPVEDQGAAYVAPKGHTFVAIEFRAENIDRVPQYLMDSFDGEEFITVNYDGQEYENFDHFNDNMIFRWESADGVNGEITSSVAILLLAGEEMTYRGYVDIPVDADLTSDFRLSFYLPKSDGTRARFNYSVTTDDRVYLENQEISLEQAVLRYPDDESKEYFGNHKNDFELVSDIGAIVKGVKFHVDIVSEHSHGEYYYVFEDGGMIKETGLGLSDKPTGYLNNLKWSGSGSDLSIVGEKRTTVYTIYKIEDNTYIGYSEGNPWILLSK